MSMDNTVYIQPTPPKAAPAPANFHIPQISEIHWDFAVAFFAPWGTFLQQNDKNNAEISLKAFSEQTFADKSNDDMDKDP